MLEPMLEPMPHYMSSEHSVFATRRPTDALNEGRWKRPRFSAFRDIPFLSRQDTPPATPSTNDTSPGSSDPPPAVAVSSPAQSVIVPANLTSPPSILDGDSSRLRATTIGADQSPASLASPSINRPVSWAEWDLDERISCFGSKCPTKRLGKHTWFVRGPLQDLYVSKVDRIVQRLVGENLTKIRKRSRSTLNWLPPLLLSSFDDGQDAEPVILLLTADARLGERARQIILRSSCYQRHSRGINILVDCRSITIPAETDIDGSQTPDFLADRAGVARIYDFIGTVGAIRGRSAFVQRVDQRGISSWTTMTLGGLLRIADTYYALSVAHFLFSEPNDEVVRHTNVKKEDDTEAKAEFRDEDASRYDAVDDSEHESDSESDFCDVLSDDDDLNQLPEIDDLFSSFISPYLGRFDVYINCHSTYTEGRFVPVEVQNMRGPFYPVCIGSLELNDLSLSKDPQLSLMSHNSDWCLIPIKNSRLHHTNKFVLPCGRSVHVNRVKRSQYTPGSKVFVATGGSGVFETSIIGPISNHVFPWAQRIHKVISIHTVIEPGDSGAWVFDDDGYFYGIAVAAVPSLSITYVLRAEDVLQDIAARQATTADLDSFLPKKASQKSDKPPDVVHARAQQLTPMLKQIVRKVSSQQSFRNSVSQYLSSGSSTFGHSSSTYSSASPSTNSSTSSSSSWSSPEFLSPWHPASGQSLTAMPMTNAMARAEYLRRSKVAHRQWLYPSNRGGSSSIRRPVRRMLHSINE